MRIVKQKKLFTALLTCWVAILISGELVLTYMLGVDPIQSVNVLSVMMTLIALFFDIIYAYVVKDIGVDRRSSS